MSELFGILQLDRGEPWGYAQVPGLVQAWLQDAGGFAAVGLVLYLLHALRTPTDKSQSEKIRVPVSQWMLVMGGLSLACYAVVAVLLTMKPGAEFFGLPVAPPERPPPPPGETVPPDAPAWHTELRPLALMFAGLFALLALGEPFARDGLKIARRNLSLGTGGFVRFWRALRGYAADLLTPNRVAVLVGVAVVYALIGVALFAIGDKRLTDIWTQVVFVALGVFVAALLLLMLFEAEGPVWAIAKLSFKEAVRSQVLWIFLIGIIPFLFPLHLMSGTNIKPADEMRRTTSVITGFLSFLALVPALLIASFGIPNDIKNLNIYTVVSKPIERFEIVLGRFVGYVALMTLVLLALSGVSLVLVANSNVSDKARAETYKARVPFRGKLEFKSVEAQDRQDKKEFTGTNVGREFDYRKYITGAAGSPHRAIWKFATVPAELATAEGDKVPVEFTFDIFRMTKGIQNKGAEVVFQFVTHNAPLKQPRLRDLPTDRDAKAMWPWVVDAHRQEYEASVERLGSGSLLDDALVARLQTGPKLSDAEQRQIEETGRAKGPAEAERLRVELTALAERQFEIAKRMKSLADRLRANGVAVAEEPGGRLTTTPVNVKGARPNGPAWKPANALAEEFGYFEIAGKEVLDYQVMGVEIPAGLFRNALATPDDKMPPGVDKQPLPRLTVYVKCESDGQMLGAAEPDLYLLQKELPYSVNFLKGTVGLWCRLCIVIGVAVACSTYLSGVLAMLATALIYVVGFFTDHLSELASGRTAGGGPAQSMAQLIKAEQPTTPMADSPSTKALLFADKGFAWIVRRIQNMIPDVDSFSWGHFVSEGFNVNAEYLVVNLLVTFGYLLPWAILAYYLMKLREVAA